MVKEKIKGNGNLIIWVVTIIFTVGIVFKTIMTLAKDTEKNRENIECNESDITHLTISQAETRVDVKNINDNVEKIEKRFMEQNTLLVDIRDRLIK